jgi:hypothetical protein
MKKLTLSTLSLSLVLAACGGGGSSANDPANQQTANQNTVTDTTSATYTEALKAFAEVWQGARMTNGLADLSVMIGNSGNCPGGGSLSFSANGNSGTQTANACVRRFPAWYAYTGSYSGTSINATTLAISSINNVSATAAPGMTAAPFTVASGSFSATQAAANGTETVSITNGSAAFNAGANNSYVMSQINLATTNNGTTLSTTGSVNILKGSAGYTATIAQPVVTGTGGVPSSGTVNVQYTSSTCGSPVFTFVSTAQFSITCNAHSITKNWTDADVVAAVAAAAE